MSALLAPKQLTLLWYAPQHAPQPAPQPAPQLAPQLAPQPAALLGAPSLTLSPSMGLHPDLDLMTPNLALSDDPQPLLCGRVPRHSFALHLSLA